MNTNRRDILESAFASLRSELGKKLNWKGFRTHSENQWYDAVFIVEGKKVYVIAKNEVRPHQLAHFQTLKKKWDNVLVTGTYITPNSKKILKEQGINYVDGGGNMFFELDPIYIHLEGRRNTPYKDNQKDQVFSKTGVKIVFQFLLNPNLINATYRDITNSTGVSLGTVSKVMKGLKEEGLVIQLNEKEWIIKDYGELLHRWRGGYLEKLKPSLFVKRYRSVQRDFYTEWKKLALTSESQWGGEPAADVLTGYLKPEQFTVYSDEPQQAIMKRYRWVPDNEGDIYLYRRFWEELPIEVMEKVVPAPLVYADLMDTDDSRCIETANIIYEQYLQKYK